VDGPKGDFEAKWPNLVQQFPFLALCNPLEQKAEKSLLKLELVATTSTFVLSINWRAKLYWLNSSSVNMKENLKKDANRALRQIVRKDYRDLEVFWTFALFENTASLAITLVHVSRGDTWSSILNQTSG
jgi:hypothetical protein